MHNRAQFWSAVPEWSQVALHGDGIHAAPVSTAAAWLVSGNADAFLAHHNLDRILGPRQRCDATHYALRLAPDRLLFVSEDPASTTFGWSPQGHAVTDISDGLVIIDISGETAAELMAQGSAYPFTAATRVPHESASMRFAGLRLAASRRARGWRLHIERPWAPALWRWLQAHIE